MLINLQGPFQEILGLSGDGVRSGKLDAVPLNVGNSLLILLPSAGNVAEQHLVIDNAHGPDVALISVNLAHNDLRVHVAGSSSEEIHGLSRFAHGHEPEISYLVQPVMNESILRFQVSVHHMMFLHLLHSFKHLLEYGSGFRLWYRLSVSRVKHFA